MVFSFGAEGSVLEGLIVRDSVVECSVLSGRDGTTGAELFAGFGGGAFDLVLLLGFEVFLSDISDDDDEGVDIGAMSGFGVDNVSSIVPVTDCILMVVDDIPGFLTTFSILLFPDDICTESGDDGRWCR